MDAGCKPGARVGLGLRYSVSGPRRRSSTGYWVPGARYRELRPDTRTESRCRYRVSGPRCQVAGTRCLVPDTWSRTDAGGRIPSTEDRFWGHGPGFQMPGTGYPIRSDTSRPSMATDDHRGSLSELQERTPPVTPVGPVSQAGPPC